MSGIEPTEFRHAAERQIELWNESREIIEDIGDEVHSRTEPPVVVADETIASHVYDETQAERERRSNTDRPEHVQQVATINQVTNDLPPGEDIESYADAWDNIIDRGGGIYRGLHPTMERDDVYIYGCPHYLVFEERQPVQVLRLRGTKYVDRPEPFDSQVFGPWLTGRILERGRFDVSDLQFTVIRYDRERYASPKQVLRLSQIQHGYATNGEVKGIDIHDAVHGLADVQVNTYEYESRFTHDSTDFAERLRQSLEILRGDRDPLGK